MRQTFSKSLFSAAAGLVVGITVFLGVTTQHQARAQTCIHLAAVVGCPAGVLAGATSLFFGADFIQWPGGVRTPGLQYFIPAHNLTTGGGLNDSTLGVNTGPGATSQRWGDYSYFGNNCTGGSCDVNGDGYDDFSAGTYNSRIYSGSVYASTWGPNAGSGSGTPYTIATSKAPFKLPEGLDLSPFRPFAPNASRMAPSGGGGGGKTPGDASDNTYWRWVASQPSGGFGDGSNFDCGWSNSCNGDSYPPVDIRIDACSGNDSCGVQPVPAALNECTASNSCGYQPPANSDCSGGQCTGFEQYLDIAFPETCTAGTCTAQPQSTPSEDPFLDALADGALVMGGRLLSRYTVYRDDSHSEGSDAPATYQVINRQAEDPVGTYSTLEEAMAVARDLNGKQQAATSSTVGRTPSSSTTTPATTTPAPSGSATDSGTQTGSGARRGFGGKPGRFGIGADESLSGVGGLSARFQVAKNFGIQSIVAYSRVSFDTKDAEPSTTSTVTPPSGPVFAPVVTRLPPTDGEEIYKSTFGFPTSSGKNQEFEIRFIRGPDGKIGAWGTGDLATHRFSDGKESSSPGFYRPEGPVVMPVEVPPPATGVAAADQQHLSGPIPTLIGIGLHSELFGASGFTVWFK